MGEQPVPGDGQGGTDGADSKGVKHAKDVDLGQDQPHSARMYDYYLGGKTNYAVDREAAQAVIRLFPAVETVARVNRTYMHRAVRWLAEQGVRQFIDVGTGIPTAPNLHDIVQDVHPGCRVMYVDNDPIVLVYADALLDGSAEGSTGYVQADATDPAAVLAAIEAEGVVDFSEPVALSLHALLHFVPDDRDPYGVVDHLMDALVPGSYLSLSHCTGDFDPESWQAIVDTYTRRGTPAQVRSRAEVERFFDRLDLEEPGVVLANRWRPEVGSGPGVVSDRQVSLYAGVARKR
ncbi:SAM-dependent methyltransferase [Streptomyces sp. NPDC091377]|uniref:SAM-dependent methyltransferase n=1 Tax=Streptomyces sp. NPDC091377 TaxID=3365995 RepID=UPI0037FEE90E